MLLPVPEAARQQHVNKAEFNITKHVVALRVPKQRCQELMRKFKGYTLDRPKLRCIVADGTREDTRMLLLSDKVAMPDGLSEELKAFVATEGFEVVQDYSLQLDYSHLNSDQVLKALLPEGVDAPSSFETIGHIIHLNLRENQLPYKYIIGQVLLDKNPHVKTVVNKVGNIDNTFRVFAMELLAGEPRTEAEVMQHGMRFRLDMAQVYWNSRLEAEHHRLVQQYFKPKEVIADIMAGVGPFAIPAALQGCTVYANDLNPSSTHYLRINARLNRVSGAVHPFTLDGREFVRLLCATPRHSAPTTSAAGQEPGASAGRQTGAQDTQPYDAALQHPSPHASAAQHALAPRCQASSSSSNDKAAAAATVEAAEGQAKNSSSLPRQEEPATASSAAAAAAEAAEGSLSDPKGPPAIPEGFCAPPGGIVFQHAIMNLPASAIEFVDAFNGAFDPATWSRRLPLVHLYTFKTAAESEADVFEKIQRIMGGQFEAPPTVHWVRDVSPGKIMLCVTFRVPEAVAFNGRGESTAAKREGMAEAERKEEGIDAHCIELGTSEAKRQRT